MKKGKYYYSENKKEYDFHNSIIEVFEKCVEKSSDRIALQFQDKTMTYAQFNQKVNQYAAFLRTVGVTLETPVGIHMERSLEMMISIYAVLKAGGAYVPLDPDYPEERLAFIAQDLGLDIILNNMESVSRKLKENRVVLSVAELEEKSRSFGTENLSQENMQNHAAYIIFTSGSTGKPKGAIIEHKSVLNRLYWMQDYLKLMPGEKVLQKTPISFDVSVWELFWPLMYSATLVIAEPGGHKEPSYLADCITRNQISTIHFVPSMLQAFLMYPDVSKCGCLERVVCSGEALEKHHAERFFEKLPESRLYNLYGPTEATVDVTYYECKKGEIPDQIPIGKAVSNCELYILDEDKNPVPMGEEGELYIGGICLCRGYHNRPELNEERFVKNTVEGASSSRMYKTGDLAKFNEDGEIIYLGRSDFQVKLRGLRIELGEIENVIRKNRNVHDAVVTVHKEEELNDSRLIAYVIPEKEYGINGEGDKNRVEEWKAIFDDTYAGDQEEAMDKVESNFSGWKSSYTGKQIPEPHMQKWVDSTVHRIEGLKNQRILELGCGTGLLLYKLAPNVARYVGIDLSDIAVDNLKKDLETRGTKWEHVSIYQGAADDISSVEGETFDCIIINSVIQLFPSIQYLYQVIEKALTVLEDGGKIFIGDVRDLKFLETFHQSVQYSKAEVKDREMLERKTVAAVQNDKELLVSQEFFQNLGVLLPDITNVEIMTKNFDVVNELSKFRYDVVLYKNNESHQSNEIVYDYREKPFTMAEIEQILEEKEGTTVRFSHVPNTILSDEQNIIDFMANDEVEPDLSDTSNTAFWPYGFYELGEKKDRKCLANMVSLKELEVVYCGNSQEIYSVSKQGTDITIDKLNQYATDPTRKGNEEQLINQVREGIARELPDYMMPSQFIMMEEFPLLPNGKLNRKALPVPVNKQVKRANEYIAPETEFEQELCKLWEELLKIDNIGMKDSFLELGGHSLLAIRLFHILEQHYGRQVSLSHFMKEPTIEGLVKLLGEQEDTERTVFEKAEFDREHLYEAFPLSDMQQAYFVGSTDEVEYGDIPTHVYTEFEFYELDEKRFEKALNDLIERHDMLRCVIGTDSTQRILKQVPYYEIKTDYIEEDSEEQVQDYIEQVRNEMFYRQYEVSSYPLFEIRMTKVGQTRTQVHICYDNIILDGASQGIMIEDMLHLYRGGKESLKPIEFSFRDYLLAEQRFRQGTQYKKAMEYWRNRCKGLPSSPKLPVCSIEKDGSKRRIRRKEAIMEANVWKKLKQLSAEVEITANTLLVSAFSEVMERWSGSKKFCLNLPSFHRFPFHEDVENMLGEFGSVHLLEVDRTLGKDFLEKTKQMQKQFWEDMDYDIVSGVDVLRELAAYQDDVLMPVVFTSLLTRDKRRSFLHEEVNTTYWRSQSSQVWLDAVVSESNGTLCIDWDYTDGLFEEEMIHDMFYAYVTLLEQLASDKNVWKDTDLDILPETQKQKRIQYNQTTEPIDEYYLHQFFYDSLIKNPQQICCISDGEIKTYHDMYQYAMKLSEQISQHEVKPNELVAILLPKGWKQIAAVLGILFSGAAYLPLDVNWPEARLNELLTDANVKIVISSEASCQVNLQDRTIISVPAKVETEYPITWNVKQALQDLAYVIYTSGSTGKPKGVAISHKAASNTIVDINQKFHVGSNDRTFALSELNFDLSVYDIFGMFAAGGTIVIPTAVQKNDVASWEHLVKEHHVSIWNTVPSLMELFLNECTRLEENFASIRAVLLSGDWIPVSVPDRIKNINSKTQVCSLGGATEASIWSIYYPITEQMEKRRSIPYGRPLANQQFYVLDPYYRDCPEYVTGELFIGGKGLASCYWGDEKKTQEKFIIHPVTGERLYATGDLGRFLGDNNIEFIGRKDFQVKVNGYRIELGEIESVLEKFPKIEKCIADIKEGEHGQKVIAAFYLANETIEKTELTQYLENRIPHYMIPAHFIHLQSVPFTDNGKVNRKALMLPRTEQKEMEISIEKRDSEVAQFLVETCRELLGEPNISIEDDFFAYGGNSITAMRVMTRIKKRYHITIRLQELFTDSMILHWVDLVEERLLMTGDQQIIEDESRNLKSVPLTIGQQGVILNELIYQNGLNALSATMKINGDLNIPRLETAIKEAIRKHPILNVNIEEKGDANFIQTQSDDISDVLLVIPFEDDLEFLQEYFIEKAEWKFDVLNEKLYNFELLSLGKQEYLFCVTLHHIISDESTFEVLFHDIIQAYQEKLDGKVEDAFFQYAYWQTTEQGKHELQSCLDYWKKKLPSVRFKDFYDGEVHSEEEGSYHELELPKDAFKSLTRICTNADTSLFAGVLSIYAITLSAVLQEEYISIGIPVSGRGKVEADNACGYFINMSAVYVRIDKSRTFLETLKEISKELLETIENSSLPLTTIIEELKFDRKYLQLPININMNVLSAKSQEVSVEGITFEPFEFTKHLVGHNLGILLEEGEEKCFLSSKNAMPKKYVTPVIEGIGKVWEYVVEKPSKLNKDTIEEIARLLHL